jgi:hypothetical protein
LAFLFGCSPSSSTRAPASPALVDFQRLSIDGSEGTRVVSAHYRIYSTLTDAHELQRVANVLEGARAEYRQLAPEVPEVPGFMECYVFQTRQQWAEFTRQHTGADASIYLRVNRGGYTVGDWFVAYWIGDIATFSVTAHEGFHQYVARHLKGRLPPFLEEGLACLFEQVQWDGDLPRWDLSYNQSRLMSLRSAIAQDKLFPLAELVRMHAGQVVGKPGSTIEAFYGQSWAFARFFYDRYRPALRQMLADAARGDLYGDSSRQMPDGPLWDPQTAKPMLEHYLGANLADLEKQFDHYLSDITMLPPQQGG